MTEAELAEVAKLYYERNGWNMFPEVCFQNFSGRPDWIGRKNNLAMVVECKLNLNFSVLEQLTRWCCSNWQKSNVFDGKRNMGIPHVLVAFVTSWGDHSFLKESIINEHGIGVIIVDKRFNRYDDDGEGPVFKKDGRLEWGKYYYSFYENKSPKIQPGSRKTAHRLLEHLNDDMKVATSGVKTGESLLITPFRRTMNRVYSVMKPNKSYHIEHLLQMIVEHGGHHYSSDKNAANGIIAGLRREDRVENSVDYGPWFKLKAE